MRKSSRLASKAITEAVIKSTRSPATKRVRYSGIANTRSVHSNSSQHVQQNGGSISPPVPPAAKRFKAEPDQETLTPLTSTSELNVKTEGEETLEIADVVFEMPKLKRIKSKKSTTLVTTDNRSPSHQTHKKSLASPRLKGKVSDAVAGCETERPIRKSAVQSPTSEMSDLLVGAHVSISGGLYKAVYEAVEIGARSFAMFLRNQRKWDSKPLEDSVAKRFRESCESMGYKANSIIPHGIYLVNCGSSNEDTLAKSRDTLVDELQRCEKLGLTMYNFHPGSTNGKISVEECLDRIAESINLAHSKTEFVTTVIENMSCQGNTVGGKFEELRGIIDRVHDKSRMGVCLDTCHAFAAGYNLKTEKGYKQMMDEFEKVVGITYLKAAHINDSKGELGCHLDRHENIGMGKIGLDGFRRVMQDPRFSGIPIILETPCVEDDTYAKEIKLLYSLTK